MRIANLLPYSLIVFGLAAFLLIPALAADEEDESAEGTEERAIDIAEGKFTLTAPEGWIRKQPKVNIIEHEFEITASEGDELPGRMTVMGAGGKIKDNISRWMDQFTQPDGSSTEDVAKVEELTIADQKVHMVDISGTYQDRPPFGGGQGVERKNYRMLAAIIVTKKSGNYFIKFVGPNQTVTDQEEAFKGMINGLQKK